MHKGNPVIHLTYRTKQLDSFLFSLFHEIKHILDGDIEKYEADDDMEKDANSFARNIIISDTDWEDFWFQNPTITKEIIINFAKTQNIPVACVIGRLQNAGIINYSAKFAELKEPIVIQEYDNIIFE